jgi:hypothetical protein
MAHNQIHISIVCEEAAPVTVRSSEVGCLPVDLKYFATAVNFGIAGD